jgi:histidinol-phosphate aminotransferase
MPMASAKDLMLPHLEDCETAAYGVKGTLPDTRLNLNEIQYDMSPKVVEAIKEQAEFGKFYVYLGDEPTHQLQEKVADYAGVDFDEVVLDEALDQAFNRLPHVYTEPGDNIVSMSPTYPELILGVERAKGKRNLVPLHEPDLAMNPDHIIEAINSKTKFVFICNPNNPTSTKTSRDDILKVVENAKNQIVVVDECYYEYCGESMADAVNDYDNLYVARSFSKGFGLAGTRMAYFISNKDACDAYSRILNGFEFNRFGVFGAMAALDDVGYYEKMWETIKNEKAMMRAELEKLGIKVWDSSTSFLFMDISSLGKTSTEVKDYFLENYKILIRDVPATFSELDNKYVSFAMPKPEIVEKLLKGMRELAE